MYDWADDFYSDLKLSYPFLARYPFNEQTIDDLMDEVLDHSVKVAHC